MILNKFARWGTLPPPTTRPQNSLSTSLKVGRTNVRGYAPNRTNKTAAVSVAFNSPAEEGRQTYILTLDAAEMGFLVAALLRADKTSATDSAFHAALAKALLS